MPAPTYSWTTIAGSRRDALSPGDVSLFTDMRDDLEFCREMLIGTNTELARVPHVHLGVTDSSVDTVTSDNLLQNSAPDDDADGDWSRTNVSIESNVGFLVSTTEGANAYQILTTRAALSKALFGATGADVCISLFLKAKTSAPTAGTFSFGLADGSNTSYISGCKGSIAFGSITTDWQRFYMTLSAKGGSAVTDVRFLMGSGIGSDTALDQQVIVTCMAVCLGSTLTYWMPGICEALGNGDTHDDWRKYGLTSAPTWEESTAITNAVQVTGA